MCNDEDFKVKVKWHRKCNINYILLNENGLFITIKRFITLTQKRMTIDGVYTFCDIEVEK